MVSALESRLWGLVVVGFIGDVVTTLVGVQLGLHEANPLVASAMDWSGIIGFLALKLSGLLVAIIFSAVVKEEQRIAIPAAFALVWVGVTVINCYMIYTALV